MNAEGRVLGNFLSGMETDGRLRGDAGPFSLGNFLSGMETYFITKGVPLWQHPWKLP